MRRLLSWGGCLTLLISSGCAICASPHDCKYAAYGGRRQRTDMVHGRVASVFDPAPEVSEGGTSGQSPQPAMPDEDAETQPDVPATSPDRDRLAPPAEEQGPDATLPQPPDGVIELPELESDELFTPDDLPTPDTLPPDLPGNGRSAQRHPLYDLFVDES